MAGLPNRKLLLLACLVTLMGASMAVSAQTTQTSSSTLDDMITLVESNVQATPDQQQLLIEAFTDVIEGGQLTIDQAVEMLTVLGWSDLDLEEDIAGAVDLLADVVAGVAAGEITDPLAALLDEDASLTPEGVINAMGKAGASDETLAQAEELVASGLPPGIVLRVTKDALRQGLSQEEITAMLDELGAEFLEGASPGQAANTATGNGSNKNQEQEENANEGENEEPENEENKNGSNDNGNGNGNDKKNENANQGNGKGSNGKNK